MINQLKLELKDFQFVITTDHDQIAIDESYIRKFVTQIDQLNLYGRSGFDSKDLKMITKAMSHSRIKVCLHFLITFYLN